VITVVVVATAASGAAAAVVTTAVGLDSWQAVRPPIAVKEEN
jgi:hypothetical protein